VSVSTGGRGGGILHFHIHTMLHVEGRVSANGQSSVHSSYSGGGAAGSVYVYADILEGSGIFEVRQLTFTC